MPKLSTLGLQIYIIIMLTYVNIGIQLRLNQQAKKASPMSQVKKQAIINRIKKENVTLCHHLTVYANLKGIK